MSGVFPEPYSTPVEVEDPHEEDEPHVDENDHELMDNPELDCE